MSLTEEQVAQIAAECEEWITNRLWSVPGATGDKDDVEAVIQEMAETYELFGDQESLEDLNDDLERASEAYKVAVQDQIRGPLG